MIIISECVNHTRDFRDQAASTSQARRPFRRAISSLLWMGCLCAIVTTLFVLALDPAPAELPVAWSIDTGHGIRAVAFAPDSRRLATGGEDGSVVLWEVGKGVEKVLSHDPKSAVLCVAFSPDGTTLATGHSNFTCVLWDVTTGKERATLTGHTGQVMSLDFSPDGAILATGDAESNIRLWDVASGRIKATLHGHRGPVCSVRFAPDGRTLASECGYGTVKLWDVSDGKCRESFGSDELGGRVFAGCLAFSPDGLMVAYAGKSGSLMLRDVATGRERAPSRTEGQKVQQVAFSALGQLLTHVANDAKVHIRGLSARDSRAISLGNVAVCRSAFSRQTETVVATA